MQTITLWQYNEITGYWIMCRKCATNEADQWLTIFTQDNPQAKFKLSNRRPK